jgi:hypothetical protein
MRHMIPCLNLCDTGKRVMEPVAGSDKPIGRMGFAAKIRRR